MAWMLLMKRRMTLYPQKGIMKDVGWQELFESKEDSLLFSRLFIPDYFCNTQTIKLRGEKSQYSHCVLCSGLCMKRYLARRVSEILNPFSEWRKEHNIGTMGNTKLPEGVWTIMQEAWVLIPKLLPCLWPLATPSA